MGVLVVLSFTVTLQVALAAGRCSSSTSGVEQRISSFWQCVDGLGPADVLTAEDLGQWARNVIDRDPNAGITVADFRLSTGQMQAALDRASAGVPPGVPKSTDVESRIAAFWKRVDAMAPADVLAATDVGQWALNVIDRDPNKRIRVDDFRAATAGMQSAFDRARALPQPLATQLAKSSTTCHFEFQNLVCLIEGTATGPVGTTLVPLQTAAQPSDTDISISSCGSWYKDSNSPTVQCIRGNANPPTTTWSAYDFVARRVTEVPIGWLGAYAGDGRIGTRPDASKKVADVTWSRTALLATAPTPAPTPREPYRVVISPTNPQVTGGGSIQLKAAVYDASGIVISNAAVVWSFYDDPLGNLIFGCGGPPKECGTLTQTGLFTAYKITSYYTQAGAHYFQCITAASGQASDRTCVDILPAATPAPVQPCASNYVPSINVSVNPTYWGHAAIEVDGRPVGYDSISLSVSWPAYHTVVIRFATYSETKSVFVDMCKSAYIYYR